MKRESSYPPPELAFERERLCNLIDSRLRRQEIDQAEMIAEELLSAELGFIVRSKVGQLKRLSRLFAETACWLIGGIMIAMLLMIMDINPFLWLKILAVKTVSVVVALVLKVVVVGRICTVLHLMVDSYEQVREAFVARLLDSVRLRGNPDAVLAQFSDSVSC